MCGIAGLISDDFSEKLLRQMNDIQKHRGPNSQNTVKLNGSTKQIGLCHQRLSIIDVAEHSNQPFIDSSKRYYMVYNGEIYNYLELKEELIKEGVTFATQSDTEVLFQSLIHWGIDKTLPKLNGMFSFAFFDTQEEWAFLVRDRFGIKPLYYHHTEENFYFASEIKTLLLVCQKKFSLNYQVVGEYLFQTVTENHLEQTFLEDIHKLTPGSYLLLNYKEKKLKIKQFSYYKLNIKPLQVDFQTATETLYEKFQDSIRLRLRSDVPIGILLSGGLDSSAMAKQAKRILNGKTVPLISAVFDHPDFDESQHIDTMANFLEQKPEKVLLKLTHEELFEELKTVNHFNDQPAISLGCIAHYKLMEKAKSKGITVILTGQGADELLCGYKKYLGFYLQLLLKERKIGQTIKTFFSFLFNGTVLSQFKFHEAKRYLPKFLWKPGGELQGEKLRHYQSIRMGLFQKESLRDRQIRDIEKLSVPALLHYEDRMSMGHGLEMRVPYLDHNLVEYVLSLPNSYKLQKGWTKYILRKSMEKDLPQQITWRKDKQGFTNPQSEWLKNELRPNVLDIFQNDSLIYELGLLNKKNLFNHYKNYCQQGIDKGPISFKEIFSPLSLEVWLRNIQSYIKE